MFDEIYRLFSSEDTGKTTRRRSRQEEVEFQINDLKKSGNHIRKIVQREEDTVIIFNRDDMEPEFILIKALIIPEERVSIERAHLHAYQDENGKLILADIGVFGEIINKGYGSLLLNCLKEYAIDNKFKVIEGWISRIDEDHIERLEKFYKKHEFDLIYNSERKMNMVDLVWRKKDT
ncbi:N-acetyltransferase [Bacillus sp. 37MA]|uniref:N-acetyltransferase n=1 Tax=Bacillus sp. 37MA TaxID=1132442 RepID=UPI00037DE91A|nr:N-acetyltransferase [Bacillus sp. 37MA]